MKKRTEYIYQKQVETNLKIAIFLRMKMFFPVCSLTNESSSESNLPYEEEYGDLPGTDG